MAVIKDIDLPNGSNALNQITISPDERYAYVTHILGRYNVPTNQVERGWINTNALSIIDIAKKELLCTVMLDDLDLGAANPYDVKCSFDGQHLLVSHIGTNELSIINREFLHQRLETVAQQEPSTVYATSLKDIQDDLSFMQDIRTRIKLNGIGAKALSVHENNVFVSMYYSGAINRIDLKNGTIEVLSLGQKAEATPERLGEMYFNDATLCKQNWQSCASCHPGNGRVDGLNWDLLNDGIGNPKNTKSLLLAHATPPAMITGIREKAEVAVRAGIRHILFTHQPAEVGDALDNYLKSLKPVPSPYLENGQLSAAAQRGKVIFEKASCDQCHSGSYYTNLSSYDVGEGVGLEKGRQFDTPSLVELWRTAPYLYDGKAQTVMEVLTKYNVNQMHGKTDKLTEQELKDLAEYCLSL
jgi:mono/diheme cytochrome c family protein